MDGTVGTLLETRLETDKVTRVAVDHGLDHFRGNGRVERRGVRRSSVAEATSGWHYAEVPTETVLDGIRSVEIVRKCTSLDLEVVLGVAPSTETGLEIRIEDG